jgi:hypothetical protein
MRPNQQMPSDAIRLEISKVKAQVQFIDRAFGLGIWRSKEDWLKWAHDLEVMREFDDLSGFALELLDATQRVLFCFRIDFGKQNRRAHLVDSGSGIELPMLDRAMVHSHRLIAHHNGKMDRYRHLLALRWSDAETLPRASGSSYESEHARKITGGRQSGNFFVGNEARRLLMVTQSGHLDYVFAKALGQPEVPNVFIHRRWVQSRVTLQPGARLSALLVATPRGVQARDVRAA